MAVKIITDTMCDVPSDFVKKYNIKVMPLTVLFGEKAYKDGIDITMDEFYKRLKEEKELPKTSQITPIEFYSEFKKQIESGNKVIAILGSSSLSGTYNSALLAKNNLNSNDIHIIDSCNITMGAGMLVVKAARMAEEGMAIEKIVEEIEASKIRLKSFFILDTLEYLYKGGRISLSASLVGSILNIKPIITAKDGRLELFDRVRGTKKAIAAVLNTIEKSNWDLNNKIVGINHTVAKDLADMLEEVIKNKYNVKEFIRGEAGAVVATYAGPGAVALYFEV